MNPPHRDVQQRCTKGVERALIFGAGPIGLLMAMALKTRGVEHIAIADVDDTRLELAESFGFNPLASGADALAAQFGQIDLSIDATGIPAVAGELVNYTVNGGKVLYFGVCPPEARVSISPYEVFRRQLTIAGAHSLNHNIHAALEAIRNFGPDNFGPDIGRLVSHQVSLSEVRDVLTKQGPAKTLKVQAAW